MTCAGLCASATTGAARLTLSQFVDTLPDKFFGPSNQFS
jgi:hypothetical protein